MSIRFSGDVAAPKARLSFVFSLPRRGRIEALNGFGGVAAVILIEEDQAFFAIPSRKVYWRGPWSTVAERFLGFPLTLRDMTGLLSGRWTAESGDGVAEPRAWTFHQDGLGRISGGAIADFKFAIKEFFGPGAVPRIVEFSHSAGEGRFTVRRLKFNTAISAEAFRPAFAETGRFRQVSWDEMERIFRDEG